MISIIFKQGYNYEREVKAMKKKYTYTRISKTIIRRRKKR